jgi:hypothetical protein
MRQDRDPMEMLAAADPLRDGERLTPEEEREADALLTRLLATPAAAGTEERRARRPRLRRWAFAAAGVACSAVAAFAAANLVDSDGPGPGVIEKAVAAVTREDVVYHVLQRAHATGAGFPERGPTVYSESWHTTDGRVHAKTFAADGSRRGRLLDEVAGRRRPGRTSGPALQYDPRENTITESGVGRAPDADAVPDLDPFGDPAAQLRALEEEGRLRLAGTTRVGGGRAYRLVSDSTTRWRGFAFERVEYLVDSETYLPLSQRVSVRVDSERTYKLFTRFLVYERLPLNEKNRALLDLDPHPGAKCSQFAGELRGEKGVGFPNPCPPPD